MHGVLSQVVALIVASAAIAYVCQRLRILPIVGFLLAGVAIGPHALGLVEDAAFIDVIAEIGIILLLFTLGIEFSLDRVWKIKRAIFVGGGLQLGLTIAASTAILAMLGVEWRTGVYTGALIALSSTAIVLKVLGDRGDLGTPKGQLSLGILIFQDLAIVALVLVMPILGNASGEGSGLALLRGLGLAALIVTLVVIVARRVMPWVLERVARTCAPEIFLLTILAICLGTAWITSLAGVSLSLGAFLAGLMVSESRFSHHAFGEIMPLQILFSAVFFVSVGLLLDVGFVIRNPLLILGVVVAIVVLKIIVTGLAARILGYTTAVAGSTAFLLAQIGEFSFVLERVGRAAGLHPGGAAERGAQTFIASAVLLMAFTPLLAKLGRKLEERRDDVIDANVEDSAAEAIERVTIENHVIVAGYGHSARYLTRVLRDSGVPFVILTLSPTGASEAQREGLRVILGDYSRTFLLDVAAIERAKMLVVADDTADMTRRVISVARAQNPTLQIVARTPSAADVDELLEAGADQVLVDEMEVGVQLFTNVLTAYQVSLGEIEDHVATVRAGGYSALRDQISDLPLVVCDDLDEECFDTRTFTVRRREIAQEAVTIGALASQAGVHVVSVERDGERLVPVSEDFVLAPGDRLTARASAQAFAAAARMLRGEKIGNTNDEETATVRTIHLTPEQQQACEHASSAQSEITTGATGCEECLKSGSRWVHLRICMKCGKVGCCDSSPNQHATKHFHASGHPVIRSYEPREMWAWCYPDEIGM
jgi:CPA2 family monovalent cation:H+ antiporter-2